jgi:hypothetical protein
MPNIKFEVYKKDKVLCEFEMDCGEKTTVEEVVKQVIGKGFKGNFDINRIRLKIGDDKGRALADKT